MSPGPDQAHSRLPNATSTTPYWRTQPHALDVFCSSETVPQIVDFAIVGGGLAGASTAYHLLTGTEPSSTTAAPSIAIFEARQACSGATGRNGGHSKIGQSSLSRFASKHGPAAALELALFVREVQREMKACAESIYVVDTLKDGSNDNSSSINLAQECEMLATGSFDVFLDEDLAADTKNEWDVNVKSMRELAKKEGREHDMNCLGDYQWLKGKLVEQVTSIRGARTAVSSPAVSLWPYKFVLGLLQHVIQLGVQLYTQTPVTRIERVSEEKAGLNFPASSPNGFTALHTPRGVTLARKVIFSSNAYVSNLLPQYENTIIPGRGTACHIVRSSSSTDTATTSAPEYTRLINTYNIYGGPTSIEYLVPRPDGSIILGGGQILYREDKSRWYDMVDDGTLIDGVREKWFEGYMGRHFRDWDIEGKDEKIDRAWTGIMGFTEDSMPHVGLIPGETDRFILAGFNGGGMASIFLVARGIARMARDHVSFEETGLPRVMKTVPGRIKTAGSRSERKLP